MNDLTIGNILNFKKHSQFRSLKDFNNHIEQWMIEYKHEFTKSQLIALKRLVRFSAKVHGVANAKINTILDAINEETNGNGISRSTFKRMIRKAEEIGLLQTKETVRKNGSQSSNLYIFQRFHTNEPPRTEGEQVQPARDQGKVVPQLNHPKTNNISKTSNIKTTSEMDHTYVPSFIDSSFVETAKPFFSAKEIYDLWLRILTAYRKSKLKRPLGEVIESANKALKQTVFLHKQKKIKRTLYGYFYRLLESYFYRESCKEAAHPILYNWLQDKSYAHVDNNMPTKSPLDALGVY